MENFNFNKDFYEACKALGEKDGGKLAMALLRYGYDGEKPDKLPPALAAVFAIAKGRVDAMVAGSKGGKQKAAAKAAPPSLDPSLEKEKEKEKEYKETSPNGEVKKSAVRFTPPTENEAQEYANGWIAEKGLNAAFDARRFIAFYESKGWLVGKTRMKDWKSAVRGWILRDDSDTHKDEQAKEAARDLFRMYDKV